jgi:hypothetical protein
VCQSTCGLTRLRFSDWQVRVAVATLSMLKTPKRMAFTRRAEGLRAGCAIVVSHLRLEPMPKFGRVMLKAGVARMLFAQA